MKKEQFGAHVDKNGNCTFRLFAPHIKTAVITLNNDPNNNFMLDRQENGFHEIKIDNLAPDLYYSYTLDGSKNIPDPASSWQPGGLNSSSAIVNHHNFDWEGDNFSGLSMKDLVIYEAHVGTFSEEGTFEGITSKLDHLSELGINTLQLMPVSQLSGTRGWGDDTVFPYAVHNNYGTPDDLKTLIRECHKRSIAIVLDVAFCKHCFVEDIIEAYEPFFTDSHNTDWGKALNFDEQHSDDVRSFYLNCALSWLSDYHADGVRITNSHLINDQRPVHFLEELSSAIRKFEHENNRTCVLLIDNKHNSPRPVMPISEGGFGVDALWNDDFHHAMHCRLTGDSDGVFCDYTSPEKLLATMQHGFAFRGQMSKFHKRAHGSNKHELPGCKFIVYSQSHTQTTTSHGMNREILENGNEAAKLCAGMTILSPYTPMLFMGEEYGETAPFHYFSDSNKFQFPVSINNSAPPESESTFTKSRLNWNKLDSDQGQLMFNFYKKLLQLRREHPTLNEPCHSRCQVQEIKPGLILMIRNPSSCNQRYVAIVYNFNRVATGDHLAEYLPDGPWTMELNSASRTHGGYGPPLERIMPKNSEVELSPLSFALYMHTPLFI